MLAQPIQPKPQNDPKVDRLLTKWTPEKLQETSDQFENQTPQEILQWAVNEFQGGIALATSFGPQSIVLSHILTELAVTDKVTIFYIDTSLLFPETYTLRDRLQERLGFEFLHVATDIDLDTQNKQFGPNLWEKDSNACCYVRKVLPLRNILNKHDAWITGIRRQQASTRAQASIIEWDSTNHLIKFNPLANWSKEQVWGYIQEYNLPYNELHDKGYPSIGCKPLSCTRQVKEGEDERSGRWSNQEKIECGLHIRDDAQHGHINNQ